MQKAWVFLNDSRILQKSIHYQAHNESIDFQRTKYECLFVKYFNYERTDELPFLCGTVLSNVPLN